MIPYPNISPEIVRIGPFAIRWYGLMYLIGFVSSYLLVERDVKHAGGKIGGRPADPEFLSSFYTWLIVGLLLGARLGYVLFYDLGVYVTHPLEIVKVWHGGMSFHGGLIGSVLAGVLCCRKFGVAPLAMADILIPTAPIGLACGRLGNFINGELYGRVTDVPWAMVFPNGGPLPRHPSQLYELLLEGVTLFIILWTLRKRGWPSGMLSALFLVLYGLFRIFVEFFRQPDAQLGFVLGPFTMGQLLSTAMVLLGGVAMVVLRRRGKKGLR
jgi:phosphatidylglycerol:prolipoprotein diacylglycerol transferase